MKHALTALLLSLLLASCSTGFRREWRQAVSAGPQPGAVGAWEGTWRSHVNGHQGRLRAVVSPPQNSAGDYNFHYHATWAKILSGSFRAGHRVTPAKPGLSFEGHHRMPDWAGGDYTYEGRIEGDQFEARYSSGKDRGIFEMKRVRPR
jgi:hypothetical protein